MTVEVKETSDDLKSFDLLHGKKGLNTLAQEWFTLVQRIREPSFYSHPLWFRAHFEVHEDDPIDFIAVRRAGRLIAVIPVTFRSVFYGLIREARLPAGDRLYMPDITVDDAEDVHSVWAYLCEQNLFDSFAVRGGGALSTSRIAACLSNELVLTKRLNECAVLTVSSYEDIWKSFSRNFRRNLKRGHARLQSELDADFECVRAHDAIDGAFDTFVELESSGWKGQWEKAKTGYPAAAAIGLSSTKTRFYREVIREFARHNLVEITFLRSSRKVFGAMISLELNEVSYLIKTAYNESVKGISPGHLLIDFVYRRYAKENKIKTINLVTAYEWQMPWRPRLIPYQRLTTFRHSPLGLLHYLSSRLRSNVQGIPIS